MSKISSLLIVEDDKDVLDAAIFSLHGVVSHVEARHDLSSLREALAIRTYDAALVDMNFTPGARDGSQGMQALQIIRDSDQHLSVVMMTAFGSVQLSVDALKSGATDFLLKPWKAQKLVDTISQAAALTAVRRAKIECFDLQAIERATIERALLYCNGSIARAAQELGLTRPTLYRRIARYAP